jgi:transcription-repair coupling factor (superfamily II helicase)
VPRVEDIAAVERELRAVLPELALRVAHGQMPAREVDEAMIGFAAGGGDILLATSIIESGLDVPRANTMVVLGPDRFGLAQLHQLRGRVGRGHAQAYCYLMTEPGAALSAAAMRRLGTLQALDRLGSGMAISLQDLDQRGAGELFGERQAGHVRLLGLGLYQEMLAAALRAEKGEPPPVEVTLQLDAGGVIPDTYVPEPIVRINLYHRLARTRDLAEVDRLADEIADRFGPAPPPLEALLQAARLRALAARLRVTRIAAGPDGVAVAFEPGAEPAPEDIDALAPLGDAIDWNGERLLLSKHGLDLEQARDLAFDLLTELD